MLRKISLTFNSVVVLVSLALLGYTFFAVEHIREHSRTFITEKTIEHSRSAVSLTKVALESPISEKWLSKEQRSKVEQEISLYEQDPIRYVTSLTSAEESSFGEGKEGKMRMKIQTYYQSVFHELIRDLRIFSGSNLLAGIFSIWLLCSRRLGVSRKALAFTFVIFFVVAISAYNYLMGITFLSILFKWHMGWWYPILIIVNCFYMAQDFGVFNMSEKKSQESQMTKQKEN